MNNGNYEHLMMETTRVHTTPKRILHWDDDAVKENTDIGIRDYDQFLRFLNDFDSLSLAEGAMTEGKWKYLYAIIRGFANAKSLNYCIYENSAGIQFDVTCRAMEYKEAVVSKEPESAGDQLQRLKEERVQIDLKIDNLQRKREQVSDRILKLVQVLLGDEFTVQPSMVRTA